MNINMSGRQRSFFSRMTPLILAVVSFMLVRIVNGDDYLNHSLLFMAVEGAMAVGAAYLLCYMMSRWAAVVMRRNIPVILAYLYPVLWASATVVGMIAVSHYVSYTTDHVPFAMGDLEAPVVIVALITVWLYAYCESALIERKYEELRLKNEQISDEIRYCRLTPGGHDIDKGACNTHNRKLPAGKRPDDNGNNDAAETRTKITLKAGRTIHSIATGDIILVEGMENYLKVYTDNGAIITRSSMKSFVERLPPDTFMQTHRSYIVNLAHVTAISANVIHLRHDYCAPVSRSLKKKLHAALRSPLH